MYEEKQTNKNKSDITKTRNIAYLVVELIIHKIIILIAEIPSQGLAGYLLVFLVIQVGEK